MIRSVRATKNPSRPLSPQNSTVSRSSCQRSEIADSVETVAAAQFYDGVVTIAGCDKNMPGCVMGMGRLNRPSLMIYGGSIRRGKLPSDGRKINIVDAFEGYGKLVAGTITPQERAETIQCACPGPVRVAACIPQIRWGL